MTETSLCEVVHKFECFLQFLTLYVNCLYINCYNAVYHTETGLYVISSGLYFTDDKLCGKHELILSVNFLSMS